MVKSCPQRIDIFGPVIGDEQTLIAFRTLDLEAKHFMQFTLEERRGRNNIFDRRQSRLAWCAAGGSRRVVIAGPLQKW